MEEEQIIPTEESVVEAPPSPLHQVTPLSKYLAMALFIIMPFAGGWIGYQLAPEQIVEIERVITVDERPMDDGVELPVDVPSEPTNNPITTMAEEQYDYPLAENTRYVGQRRSTPDGVVTSSKARIEEYELSESERESLTAYESQFGVVYYQDETEVKENTEEAFTIDVYGLDAFIKVTPNTDGKSLLDVALETASAENYIYPMRINGVSVFQYSTLDSDAETYVAVSDKYIMEFSGYHQDLAKITFTDAAGSFAEPAWPKDIVWNEAAGAAEAIEW